MENKKIEGKTNSILSALRKQSRNTIKENAKSVIGVTIFFCVTFFVIQVLSSLCSRHIINSVFDVSHFDLYFTIERILLIIFVMILSLPLQVGYFSCCLNKSFSIKELFSFYSIKKLKSLSKMFIFAAIPFSVPCGAFIYNLVIRWRLSLFTLFYAILTFILGMVLLISIFLYLHSPFEKYTKNIKQSYKIFLRSFTDIIKFNLAFIPWVIIILIMIRLSYHLYIINANINILILSKMLIFPTMYGFGLVVIPYYTMSLVNMLEKIKSGRRLIKKKDKHTQLIVNQSSKKTKRKRIIAITLASLIALSGLVTYIFFPYIKGRYLISTQKDNISNIVSYMKSNYSTDDKYACLNYDNTFVVLDQNMKPSKSITVEDNNIVSSTNNLHKKIKDDINGSAGIVCTFDNNGRVAVNISYSERDIPFSKSLQETYIVYIEKNFDMSYYKNEEKLKKIDGNWYILSQHID